MSTPIGRLVSRSTVRIMPTSSRMRSWLVWLMLMRKTSAPASNRRAIISALDDAGPSVATILARRRRLMVGRLRAMSPTAARLAMVLMAGTSSTMAAIVAVAAQAEAATQATAVATQATVAT